MYSLTQLARASLLRTVAAGALTLVAGLATASTITAPLPAGVAGNGQSSAPFSNVGDTNGNRYQEIFASSFFDPLGGVLSIQDVAFRPKQGAFLTLIGSRITISNVQVRLSTTTRSADTNFPNGLSGNLDSNVGADVQTVYAGALTLSTDRVLGDTDVENFDFLIAFQNPFLYMPRQGHLLLDILIPAVATVRSSTSTGANANNFPQIDTFTDAFPSMDGVASAVDSNLTDGSSIGSNSTTGVVAQFNVVPVPEPATVTLFGVGLGMAVLVAARRRRVNGVNGRATRSTL